MADQARNESSKTGVWKTIRQGGLRGCILDTRLLPVDDPAIAFTKCERTRLVAEFDDISRCVTKWNYWMHRLGLVVDTIRPATDNSIYKLYICMQLAQNPEEGHAGTLSDLYLNNFANGAFLAADGTSKVDFEAFWNPLIPRPILEQYGERHRWQGHLRQTICVRAQVALPAVRSMAKESSTVRGVCSKAPCAEHRTGYTCNWYGRTGGNYSSEPQHIYEQSG